MFVQSMTPNGVDLNGHRNGGHPQLETLPQLLEQLREATDDLNAVVGQTEQLIASVDDALEFIDRRVEMARARERRRDRRNRRKHS